MLHHVLSIHKPHLSLRCAWGHNAQLQLTIHCVADGPSYSPAMAMAFDCVVVIKSATNNDCHMHALTDATMQKLYATAVLIVIPDGCRLQMLRKANPCAFAGRACVWHLGCQAMLYMDSHVFVVRKRHCGRRCSCPNLHTGSKSW